jgi:hypothetical protein
MLAAFLLSGALLVSSQGAHPGEFSERDLCELWVGAQCHAARCGDNAKQRCQQESKRCRGATRATASAARAKKVADCAKAMLKTQCGAPAPAECSGVTGP